VSIPSMSGRKYRWHSQRVAGTNERAKEMSLAARTAATSSTSGLAIRQIYRRCREPFDSTRRTGIR
jgi:hypothetical protein